MDIIKNKYSKLENIETVAILADPACRSCWKKNTPPLMEHVWGKYRPDLFLVAGDLAVNGAAGEFQAFIAEMERYPALMAAVPGDHDLPLQTFMRYFGPTRKIIDVGQWRFIGLNTANRVFSKSEAEFLDRNIRPNTLIFTHIPPGVDGWTFHSFRPYYSGRFLSIIDRHASDIKGAFFGHIHGYSRKEYAGVPLVCTGGVAESYAVRNNGYGGPGRFQMMLFNTGTGKMTLCRRD